MLSQRLTKGVETRWVGRLRMNVFRCGLAIATPA
jgi:hypothetical protein